MSKPMVRYRSGNFPVVVGQAAHVYTLDHPNAPLNHSVYGVRTSEVLRVDEDGVFETLNTIYVPAEKAHATDDLI